MPVGRDDLAGEEGLSLEEIYRLSVKDKGGEKNSGGQETAPMEGEESVEDDESRSEEAFKEASKAVIESQSKSVETLAEAISRATGADKSKVESILRELSGDEEVREILENIDAMRYIRNIGGPLTKRAADIATARLTTKYERKLEEKLDDFDRFDRVLNKVVRLRLLDQLTGVDNKEQVVDKVIQVLKDERDELLRTLIEMTKNNNSRGRGEVDLREEIRSVVREELRSLSHGNMEEMKEFMSLFKEFMEMFKPTSSEGAQGNARPSEAFKETIEVMKEMVRFMRDELSAGFNQGNRGGELELSSISGIDPDKIKEIKKIEKESAIKQAEIEKKYEVEKKKWEAVKELGRGLSSILENLKGMSASGGAPVPRGIITVACPNCRGVFGVSPVSGEVTCPYCGSRLRMPSGGA